MNRLDEAALLARHDPHGVRDVFADFPAQCRKALALGPLPPPAFPRPRVVVVAAMGGSAASGDLLAALAALRADVPVLVHRGYGLPPLATRDALVIASSYSGQTAEVLSAFDAAVARGVPTVAVTTGAALGARAARHGIPCVALPEGLMPRMALGYLLFPLLTILETVGLPVATEDEIAEALDVLERMVEEIAPARPTGENEAKRLALDLAGRVPAIYGGPLAGVAAYRWKTDLAENAKRFAFAGALPEMNHNEIEAWQGTAPGGVHALFLREGGESPEIARRFEVLRELIAPAAGGVSEVWARGEAPLARLLSLVALGQWVSFYVAMLAGVDPWPIPLLDALKRRLSS